MDFTNFTTIVRDLLTVAFQKYNITHLTANDVAIQYNLRGRAIGKAGYKRVNGKPSYYLKFNPQAMVINLDDMINDTIPHEVAHTICQIRPDLGHNHDAGWKRVCVSLGGKPDRCYRSDDYRGLPAGKTIKRFSYMVDGEIIPVGPKHHKAIQAGGLVTMKRTNTRILPSMLIGSKTVTPTVINATPSAPKPSLPIPQHSTGTKTERALALMKQFPDYSRAQMIELFITNLDMSKAGAGTYYQNLKKKL